MNYIDRIESMEACPDALDWLRESDHPTPEAAWAACPRADWMLWLLGRGQFDPRALVSCACDIAETVLRYVPAGEGRPRIAIETARRWARGEATEAELRSAANAARSAAYAARCVARAADADDAAATRCAAHAAAYAADAAANAAEYAPEHAADAAAYAAANAAAADDTSAAPDIVRRHFPNPPALGAT